MLKQIQVLTAVSLGLLLSSCSAASSGFASRFQAPQGGPALFQAANKARSTRSRDPVALIQQFHKDLIQRAPELVRTKYQAMAESPFAFYRATAFLYYADMARETALASPLKIWTQGDFHLENMGTYRTQRGGYAYDLNDFDEAVQAPYTWELARLSASIQLAADETGFKGEERAAFVAHFLERYLYHLGQVSRSASLLAQPLTARYLSEKPAKAVAKATEFERAEYLAEMTQGGRLRLSEKMLALSPVMRKEAEAGLAVYARSRPEGPAFYKVKDAAARVAGKGSLGRYRYTLLVEGPSLSPLDDVLLEIKEAAVPSAEAFAAARTDQATRILQAFRYFVPEPDPLLGVTRIHNLPAYVRELLPKETVDLSKLNKTKEYLEFLDTVALVGARAHARSGQAARILAESKSWQALLPTWSDKYAEQVGADWQAFRQALQARKL
ncbi:MAG: DUF2252 family protein [Candidatus Sericytochromatia bacterium]|nr:DUF2252 family protein [Candidatus Sericytochromatia bacterium]